ncbi:hypothetical protein JHW43_008381 [Diplocarpon mali]|nr:hypothetical protein JHW43_008381 [Diplocarpon mali]
MQQGERGDANDPGTSAVRRRRTPSPSVARWGDGSHSLRRAASPSSPTQASVVTRTLASGKWTLLEAALEDHLRYEGSRDSSAVSPLIHTYAHVANIL